MLVRMLGFFDLLCGFIILLSMFLPKGLIMIAAVYLITKGIIYALAFGDMASFFDVGVGLFAIWIIARNVFLLGNAICFLFLLQKGLFCFF